MSLKLGSITTIVVSSPTIAREMLRKHDQTFSSRTTPDAATALDHHKISMVWLPATNQWRKLRKISKEQIFASQPLDASEGLRRKKVEELLEHVEECCVSNQAVDVGKVAFTTSLNMISNIIISIDMSHHDSNSSQEFKDIVWAVLKYVGKPNLVDFFPALKLIDPQRIRRLTKFYMEKLLMILDDVINQRLQSRASSSTSPMNNDLLEALLDLNQNNDGEMSLDELKHLLMVLIIAGTDTTSGTVEWAMTELLRNPRKMEKARAELQEVIGKERLVQEPDISRLPYLHAVVKETLRLHPAAPLLIPRKAEADVDIDGHMIPKNAQVLINVWAIGRDSSIWLNPDSFVPERFLDHEIDFKGQDFELIPFGAGRRICPGLPLANKMVHLMLASLLHKFDWKLEEGMKPEDIDMNENFGLTLQKAMPLKTIPVKTLYD